MITNLFSTDMEAVDPLYEKFRSREDLANHRAVLEELWCKYTKLADSHFLSQAVRQFLPRFWEMKLGCVLMDYLPHVEKVGEKGPDFKCRLRNGLVTYVEATCPGAGDAGNKVKDIESDSAGWVPVDEVVLRLTSVFEQKHRIYRKYIKERVVGETDPFVIAISGCGVPHTSLDSDPPYIVRALFPLGSPYVSVDPKGGGVVGQGYSLQREIQKAHTGAIVRKDMFFDTAYSGISAVIYSQLHPYFIFDSTMQHLKIVHNPKARNPVPRGFLPTGFEYWYEDGYVKRKRVGST